MNKNGGNETTGSIRIKTDIINKISYPDYRTKEDIIFSDRILKHYDNCYRLSVSLIFLQSIFI